MIEEIIRIARLLAGNPGSSIELGAILVLSIAACIGVVDKVTASFKFPLTGTGRAAALVLGGILLTVAAVAAANLYIAPRVKTELFKQLVPIAAGLLVFLAIVGTAACFLFKSPYFKGLFTIILGVAAAAVLSLLIRAAIGAIHSGGKDFQKTKNRTERVNKVL